MKELCVDDVAAVGIRCGADQLTPSSCELENTMSFAVQPGRKRQSPHATTSVPAASTSSDGSEIDRSGPEVVDWRSETMIGVNVAPPSVERAPPIVPWVAAWFW